MQRGMGDVETEHRSAEAPWKADLRFYIIYIVSTSLGLHCRRNDLCTRLDLARKFKAMYRSLGMDLPQCAKFLHVTERTLHNWESGKHDIPYATFKLLRLMNGLELPGQTWAGWEFRGGKLWSPEGRSFEGTDGSWWSLLVRQAHGFRELMARGAEGRLASGKAAPHAATRPAAPGSDAPASERREAPAQVVLHRSMAPMASFGFCAPPSNTGVNNGVSYSGIGR